MGTDIHGVFQRHNPTTGKWEDIPHRYEMERHYQLFAVLAGVRNGVGFAGIRTGEPVQPISEPRGYPDGFVSVGPNEEGADAEDMHPITTLDVIDPRRRQWHEDDEPMSIWMGDHSHSWLTADEMLAWYAAAPKVTKTGVLDRETYEQWDKQSPPVSYSGNVFGNSVVMVNDNTVERSQTPDWNYIRCHWKANLLTELAYFFDEVTRLQREFGQVRFVFGFDS